MRVQLKTGLAGRFALLWCALFLFAVSAHAAEPDRAERLRQGERIYREGILPDGSRLVGKVLGEKVEGASFSCANCHARGGLGFSEGRIAAPPVNGPNLFAPRYPQKEQLKNLYSKSKGKTRNAPQIRPPFTEESLATTIRSGADPAGRELIPIMPRYELADREMGLLVDYLKTLSSAPSPGVSDTTLRFATIVTEGVSREDREAMLAQLDTMVTINRQWKTQKQHRQFARMYKMLDSLYYRDITVATWELKGGRETWRAQLEEYYRKEPVFAILGGIASGPWRPMHEFCEEHGIPCLFPITDLPVVSGSSWYTLYASKGYYQEGEMAARFIASQYAHRDEKRILQIVVEGDEGEALSSGFDQTWAEAGVGTVETVRLPEVPDAAQLALLLRKYRPATAVIWGGPGLNRALAENEKLLPQVVVSSRYLGKAMWEIPETVREKTFITYPYRLPEDEKSFRGYGEIFLLKKPAAKDEKRIQSRTYSLLHVFLLGLKELKADFYRDTLLDLIGMLPDQNVPDFERFTFGPGQRYASKGCYLVQLGPGAEPKLIRRSDWVVF